MASHFVEYDNIVPLISPVDTAATALESPWVDLKTAHSLAFYAFFGNIASGTADSNITVTVEAATGAASTSAAAVGFDYRLSGAVGANSWGAITSATTTGVTIASDDDNKMLCVMLDPSAVQAAKADARYVRLIVSPVADHTAVLVNAFAVLAPRYRGNSMISAT
jgi:hypothetical protein